MGRNYALNTRQIAVAADLYRDGWSRRQIARRFDVSERAVTNGLRLAGVKLRDKRYATAMSNRQRTGQRCRVASVFQLAQAA